MRKKRERLEEVPTVAALRRQIDSLLVIEQCHIACNDPAAIRTRQSRETVKQRGLPRPRRSEENGDARRDRQFHLEAERVTVGEVDRRKEGSLLRDVALV